MLWLPELIFTQRFGAIITLASKSEEKNMKVVVAIDSFKGSATSAELNQAVKMGF